MIPLYQALARIATDLDRMEVPWALVGGLALAVHADPRQTRDVDCAIAVATEKEAEEIIRKLHDKGYRDHPEGALLEEPRTGRLKGVRLLSPGVGEYGSVVDLLSGACGIEREIVQAANETQVDQGLVVPVATRGHLMAMKVVAWRDKDRGDLRALLEGANDQDLRVAREALDLIDRRSTGASQLSSGESFTRRFQGFLDDAAQAGG